jgi:arginine/lysine/ornithine decarboxylase
VYNAIYLNELVPVYVMPEYIEEYGINGGILPENVDELLKDNKDIKAVIITSPTYEGVVSDIKSIADIVHRRNIPLIVDEAHGAHFGMHPKFPVSALMMGADVVIQSVHKTLPALTQTALLHIKSDIVNPKDIEKYLHIYQTSSPSYVLMSSIDECINMIKTDGILLFEPYVKRLEVLKEHGKQLTHIKLLSSDVIGRSGVYDLDLSKIVISVRGTSYTGKKVYDEMLDRFHLQLEMAAGDYAIAMTSPMDTEDGLLRLFTALVELDRDIRIYGDEEKPIKPVECRQPKPIVLESIYKAVSGQCETLPMEEAVGKISVEYIYLYPPGIPILAPGELINVETVNLVNEYRNRGLEVQGLEDEKCDKIHVIKEEFKKIDLRLMGKNIIA